jgi:hypothetical protein
LTGNLKYLKGYGEMDYGNSAGENPYDETDHVLDAYSRAVISVVEKLTPSVVSIKMTHEVRASTPRRVQMTYTST